MKKFLSSLPIVILFGSLIGPAAYFKQWWLFSVFMIFGVCFGAIEVISDRISGNTVSQHFWEFKKKNKKGAYVVIGCMILAWTMLIVHFLWHS